VGRPEGRSELGTPRHRRENNIKMDLQEMGWKVMKWIALVQDWDRWWAFVNLVLNFWVP